MKEELASKILSFTIEEQQTARNTLELVKPSVRQLAHPKKIVSCWISSVTWNVLDARLGGKSTEDTSRQTSQQSVKKYGY